MMNMGFLSMGGALPVITLSGETISGSNPANSTAKLRFNVAGTMEKKLDLAAYAGIDGSTDWIIPNGEASPAYEVRYVSHTGDAFTTEAAAENTWISLGFSRIWGLNSTTGLLSCSVTFEIRISGDTKDTAIYAFSVDGTPD